MKKYIYPQLPGHDFYLFRTLGYGLANCLFVYAQAIVKAQETDKRIIFPSWLNFAIGPYLRQLSDKRHYNGLFLPINEISGIRKIIKLLFCRYEVEIISGFGNYFKDLINDVHIIAPYIIEHINHKIINRVNGYNFENCVAVHIRLGDYPLSCRTPIEWYVKQITKLSNDTTLRFLIFSDGSDKELTPVLTLPYTQRINFGNAIADILAISKCSFMIGSDSTFSGWGAYLGQVPCIFYRKHYGPVLKDSSKETVEDSTNMWLQ